MSQKIITVDGPSGAGKGTVSKILAARLGYSLLDSGALYRLVALSTQQKNSALSDINSLTEIAKGLNVRFAPRIDEDGVDIFLDEQLVTEKIRTQECGMQASKIAAIPEVREALLAYQRAFYDGGGLIADGRDMGIAIFPKARLKIFLTASAEERANRRYQQLIKKGFSASIRNVLSDVSLRDRQDAERSASPMVPAEDAVVIDSSEMGISEVTELILALYYQND